MAGNLIEAYLILLQGCAKDIPLSQTKMKAPAIIRAPTCINMFSAISIFVTNNNNFVGCVYAPFGEGA
jgi:hypothetical protein